VTGKWLSKNAVLWVLDEAPDVPARLVSTLIAVARYTGTDGRGARAAASEIARCTRKSERQAQRDIAELEQLGLLRRGDPRLAAHIPANFRPNVYDIPLDTSPMSYQAGKLDTSPVTAGYDMQGPNGTSPMSYDQSLKSSGIGARANGAEAPRARRPKPRGQCDLDGPDPHSNACRRGGGRDCHISWCQCRCHPVRVAP